MVDGRNIVLSRGRYIAIRDLKPGEIENKLKEQGKNDQVLFGKLQGLNDTPLLKIKGFSIEALRDLNYNFTGDTLILDLRDNGGGSMLAFDERGQLVEVFKEIAAKFLGPNKFLGTELSKRGKKTKLYTSAKAKRKIFANKIVVLVNKKTASAAEMLTGALQDSYPSQVVVLGEQTTGKSVVQQDFELAFVEWRIKIKVTSFKYIFPNGRFVQGVGIKPDIVFDSYESFARAMGVVTGK